MNRIYELYEKKNVQKAKLQMPLDLSFECILQFLCLWLQYQTEGSSYIEPNLKKKKERKGEKIYIGEWITCNLK